MDQLVAEKIERLFCGRYTIEIETFSLRNERMLKTGTAFRVNFYDMNLLRKTTLQQVLRDQSTVWTFGQWNALLQAYLVKESEEEISELQRVLQVFQLQLTHWLSVLDESTERIWVPYCFFWGDNLTAIKIPCLLNGIQGFFCLLLSPFQKNSLLLLGQASKDFSIQRLLMFNPQIFFHNVSLVKGEKCIYEEDAYLDFAVVDVEVFAVFLFPISESLGHCDSKEKDSWKSLLLKRAQKQLFPEILSEQFTQSDFLALQRQETFCHCVFQVKQDFLVISGETANGEKFMSMNLYPFLQQIFEQSSHNQEIEESQDERY